MSSMCGSIGHVVRLLALSLVTVGATTRAVAETTVSRPTPAPPTIQIASPLLETVDAMLIASPTFRQQFARIVAAPRLVLCAFVNPALTGRSYRARSVIRRYDSGLIIVNVEIGPGHHQAEWIAHEFEHVIEQLDGLNLTHLANHRQGGTWFSAATMIETERAWRMGRTVMDELRGRRTVQTSLLTEQRR